MGFGSYDESEQEQDTGNEEDTGENVTSQIKGENSKYEGTDSVENTVEEMMDLL